jgi:hypothetical protein
VGCHPPLGDGSYKLKRRGRRSGGRNTRGSKGTHSGGFLHGNPPTFRLRTTGELSWERYDGACWVFLPGCGIYLLVALSYVAILYVTRGGLPDTYLPFIWPPESPFLIFRYTWQLGSVDENLLSLFGRLLTIGGAIWGYRMSPPSPSIDAGSNHNQPRGNA